MTRRLAPALVVLGLTSMACQASPTSTPPSTGAVRSSTGSATPQQIGTTPRHAHLAGLGADGAGDLLAVWAKGWDAAPPENVVVRSRSGGVHRSGLPGGSSTRVLGALPRGWLVGITHHDVESVDRVQPDGRTFGVLTSPRSARPERGDLAVVSGGRVLLYRPATGLLHRVRMPIRRPAFAWVTGSGVLVIAGGDGRTTRWATYDGHQWTRGRWPVGRWISGMSGSGDTVAVVLGGSPVVDATPVAGVAVSEDGGASWRVRPAPSGIAEALNATTTRSGQTFVATGSGQLLRVSRAARISIVPGATPFTVTATGGRLYAASARHRHFSDVRLATSTDLGLTWRRATQPR